MRRPLRAAPALACACAFLAGTVFLLRRRYLVITVEGRSMEPSYREGDRILVRRTPGRHPRRGEVAVLAANPDELRQSSGVTVPRKPYPGETTWIIKRVLAAPGDPVPHASVPAVRDMPESRVPSGFLLVIGDNQADSYDSRHYGYLPLSHLVGLAVRPIAPKRARRAEQDPGIRPMFQR
ncbi:S26 family signal peptidase [Nonomuraea sp. NPDC046802]|uniref:S26 family signal peptidase n=1 Tax=Nonomuraea sp. NPDC046802 TaxID=3154919 RepID=UPI0033E35F0A